MSEERQWRIVGRTDDSWAVQYGYWAPRGSTRRFMALCEWPADTYVQAHAIVAREKVQMAFSPLPVTAQPLPDQHAVTRAIDSAPVDPEALMRRAVEGLGDPLPSVEELHAELGVPAPQLRDTARQFYVHLPEPVYGLLCAMAVSAGTTRNRIIEALILTADLRVAEGN